MQDESVMLCEPDEFLVLVLCTALVAEASHLTHGPYLSPATPPPRIYAA